MATWVSVGTLSGSNGHAGALNAWSGFWPGRWAVASHERLLNHEASVSPLPCVFAEAAQLGQRGHGT